MRKEPEVNRLLQPVMNEVVTISACFLFIFLELDASSDQTNKFRTSISDSERHTKTTCLYTNCKSGLKHRWS